jgi:hypothetical protein
MQKINFYFLSTEEIQNYKIIINFYESFKKLFEKIVLLSNSEDFIQSIDRYLWIFKQDQFITHDIISSKSSFNFNDNEILLGNLDVIHILNKMSFNNILFLFYNLSVESVSQVIKSNINHTLFFIIN